ncbi:MAG TPA: hypothetical protein VNJ07_06730 [Chitinophagales bacterium]|nr:hypothetical protein [Chitinophagales bacterium]
MKTLTSSITMKNKKKNQLKKMPSLVDEDIISVIPSTIPRFVSVGKIGTVAIALSIIALSSSCTKSDSKDSDYTRHADAGTTYYDSDSYDSVHYLYDGDSSTYGDSKDSD